MPFRTRRDLHPVNQEKHEITWSKLADASATQDIQIAIGTKDVTGVEEVRIGSHINWLYVEFNVTNDATTDMIFHWKIVKEPFGTNTTAASTYDQIDKRFIMKRGMEMLSASEPGTIFKRMFTVKIPQRFRRMGDTDQLILKVTKSSATATNFCGFIVFKETF